MWEYQDQICDVDRNTLKKEIIACMASCGDQIVLNNLEDCVKVMAEYDYPNEWEELITDVGEKLASETPVLIYVALKALKQIVKNYNTVDLDRSPLF